MLKRIALLCRATTWLLIIVAAHGASAIAAEQHVGVSYFAFRTASGEAPINAYVFYPASADQVRSARIGPYDVQAEMDAAELKGAKPLIVISHGQGGSALGHHDLATYLAARGHVVASLEHPKDNVRDGSGVGTAEVLLGRPHQVSALIDALAADARWGRILDRERIGVAGFSMGGYTGLALVGARPNFLRLLDLCDAGLERGMCDLLAKKGAALDAEQPARAYVVSLESAAREAGTLADPRVKAAFVMAPMALVFDQASFTGITRPVHLHYGTADRLLDPAQNANNVIRWLPTLAGRTAIVGSDHWVYLAPCSAELAEAASEICSDAPGIDRAKLHRQIQKEALDFFAAHLES